MIFWSINYKSRIKYLIITFCSHFLTQFFAKISSQFFPQNSTQLSSHFLNNLFPNFFRNFLHNYIFPQISAQFFCSNFHKMFSTKFHPFLLNFFAFFCPISGSVLFFSCKSPENIPTQDLCKTILIIYRQCGREG